MKARAQRQNARWSVRGSINRKLSLEPLEDRTLMATGSSLGIHLEPGTFDPTNILVRFHSEATKPDVSRIVGGATLDNEIKLVPGLHPVQLQPGTSVEDAINAFRAHPAVMYAEPSYTNSRLADTIPNDPSYNTLYGMTKISAPKAWDIVTGKTNITTAVMDTGLDYNHPDLYLNVWINQAEIPATRLANLIDTDSDGLITFWDLNVASNQGPGKITDLNGNGRIDAGDILTNMTKDGNGNDTGSGGWADALDQGANGYVDDLVGWNRFSNNKTPTDGYGHGTHVSGTIGAIGNNNVGVAGVNWKAQIMTLKIFSNSGGYVGDTGVIQMFDYAVANGAQLSNHSWGGGGFSQAMKDAISAMGSAGHIFVAAAGNNGANNDVNKFYPATYGLPNIISVAATDSADNKASFSNYGANSVHLGAPGVNVNSTLPTTGSLMGTNYGQASGTSMASPHTAGSIALLWSQHPNYSYRRVIRQILNFVDKVPSMNGKSITGGRLNVGAAVVNAPGAPIPPAPGLAARQAEQTAALGAGLVSSGQADSTILGAGEVHYASPWGDTVNVASAQRLVARPNVVDAEWVDVDFASWA